MEAFLSGVIAGYGIAIPVGAIAILIVQTGIKCGFRCALSAGAGAATVDALYAALAVVGGAALAQAIEDIGDPLRIVSGVVLIMIALFGLRSAREPIENTGYEPPSTAELAATFARFFGLTLINPMTVVYFAAVVIGLGVAADLTPRDGVVFVFGAFLASMSWQALIAAIGGFAGARMTPRIQRAAVVAGNVLILGLAAAILLR